MNETLVEQFVKNPEHMRLFLQERAIYEVTELIESRMRELGISRSELAMKLGKSKGWVTQLLDLEKNKTIRTVADVFAVLGHEFHAFSQSIRISNVGSALPVAQEPDSSAAVHQMAAKGKWMKAISATTASPTFEVDA